MRAPDAAQRVALAKRRAARAGAVMERQCLVRSRLCGAPLKKRCTASGTQGEIHKIGGIFPILLTR
jgi:hypothetical protein